jgi:RNA polymerase sigma factor (sigma-70 family)
MKLAPEDPGETQLAALMRAAQSGDAAAYRELLATLAPLVHRMARGRLGAAEDADDIVQDALLSVHQVRHTYDPARRFMPWFAAIVRNRVIDAQRRLYRRAQGEVAVEILPETFSAAAANEIEGSLATSDELRQAMAKLPAGQRQAVELLRLRELSLREASGVSGVSEGALKVSMHRAMKTLRKLVGSRRT